MKLFALFFIILMYIIPCSAQTQSLATIHFKELQKFLPTKAPDEFTMEKPKGQSFSSSGVSTSNASIEFTSPKKEKQLITLENGKEDSVEVDVLWRTIIEIVDYAGMGEGVFTSLQMVANMEFENQNEHGYEKSITYNTFKGIEKVSNQEYSKSCSIQLIIGDRFLVNANGSGFSDITLLYTFLNEMNLKKLHAAK